MPDTHATPDYDLTDEPEEVLTPQQAATSRFIERMLELHEQGRQALNELLNESEPTARYRLYRKLRQINDAVGLPTDSMEILGVEQPVMEVEEKRAAISCKPTLSKVDKEIAEIDAYVKKIAASKEESIAFLQRAGILDENGEIAEPYRD